MRFWPRNRDTCACGEQAAGAIGLMAQPGGQPGCDLAPPGPQEVVVHICLRESGLAVQCGAHAAQDVEGAAGRCG